jgi:hypothetical protein
VVSVARAVVVSVAEAVVVSVVSSPVAKAVEKSLVVARVDDASVATNIAPCQKNL